MQWVASTLHTTSEHGVSSITTADGAHLGCQQSTELTPRPPGRFKWTRPFRAKDEIWVSAHVPSHFNWPVLLYLCYSEFRRLSQFHQHYDCQRLHTKWFIACEQGSKLFTHMESLGIGKKEYLSGGNHVLFLWVNQTFVLKDERIYTYTVQHTQI